MGEFNVDNPRTTFDLSRACKVKLKKLADAENLSVTQILERIVLEADERPTVRDELSQFEAKLADFEQKFDALAEKITYKATRPKRGK